MEKTSSLLTGGVTVSAATIVPLIDWVMGGCPKPIPDGVPLLIAAGVVTVGHAIYNVVTARMSNSSAPPLPNPTAPPAEPAVVIKPFVPPQP